MLRKLSIPVLAAFTATTAAAEDLPSPTAECTEVNISINDALKKSQTHEQQKIQTMLIEASCLLNASNGDQTAKEFQAAIQLLKANIFVIASGLELPLIDNYNGMTGNVTPEFAKDLINLSYEIGFWPLFSPHFYVTDTANYPNILAFTEIIEELAPEDYTSVDVGVMMTEFNEKDPRSSNPIQNQKPTEPQSSLEPYFTQQSCLTVHYQFIDETLCYLDIDYQAGSGATPYFPPNLDI